MDVSSLVFFLLAVALGSYFQALTGFALGIFILGGAIALQVSTVSTTATAINIMAMFNVAVALRGSWRNVNGPMLLRTLSGLIPGVFIGLWLLNHLSERNSALLQLLLGILIVAGGIMLFVRPEPRAVRSHSSSFAAAGLFGGMLGGLFSVPGPPVVYHYYRQPLAIEGLRTTLLAIFGTVAVCRFLLVSVQGQLTSDALSMGILSVPVVSLATWMYVRYPPAIPDLIARRSAFVLLVVTGFFIAATAMPPAYS